MTDRKPPIEPGQRPRFATFVADTTRKADGRAVTYYEWPESPDQRVPADGPPDPPTAGNSPAVGAADV